MSDRRQRERERRERAYGLDTLELISGPKLLPSRYHVIRCCDCGIQVRTPMHNAEIALCSGCSGCGGSWAMGPVISWGPVRISNTLNLSGEVDPYPVQWSPS